jgi:hypothetical protein
MLLVQRFDLWLCTEEAVEVFRRTKHFFEIFTSTDVESHTSVESEHGGRAAGPRSLDARQLGG